MDISSGIQGYPGLQAPVASVIKGIRAWPKVTSLISYDNFQVFLYNILYIPFEKVFYLITCIVETAQALESSQLIWIQWLGSHWLCGGFISRFP